MTPAASPTLAATSPRPLPDCAYLDEPVLGDPATDWATLVLDTVFTLPSDFEPERLVDTGKAGLNKGFKVSRVMLDDLTAMAKAAKDDGAALAVQSAYRSYAYQVRTFQGWVDQSSEEEARTVSARPGHSEHQLGTGLDFRSADDATPPWDFDDWATTDAGAWLAEHAWAYGFVMSYPKGKRGQTCYAYEPWHYRYVGRDVAAAIHDSGQTPRRYLWETYWASR
ncbi:MAG: M15 family metallopeptidase [Chloroflexota bacterium]